MKGTGPCWDPKLGQLGPRDDAPSPGSTAPFAGAALRLLGSRFLAALQMEKGLLAH